MTDLSTLKLRGPVRTLRTELAEWDAKEGVWKAPRGLTITTFRRDGRCSESEFHNPDGSVARTAHTYNDRGRLAEVHHWMNDGPRTRLLHSYDATGRPLETVQISPDGNRRQVDTSRYDAFGRKTEVSFLASPGNGIVIGYGIEAAEHSYGVPVTEHTPDPAGVLTRTTTYDERGLPSESSFHNANHELVMRIVLSRDREGRVLTEEVQHGPETAFPIPIESVPPAEREGLKAALEAIFPQKAFSRVTYAYDKEGRVLARTIRMGTLSEQHTTFRYDDHDNPIVEVTDNRNRSMGVGADGTMRTTEEAPRTHQVRYDYRYDSHDNWTERVVWSRIDPNAEFVRSNVERRTITYFEL